MEIFPVRAKRAYTVWYYNSEIWADVYLYVENIGGYALILMKKRKKQTA